MFSEIIGFTLSAILITILGYWAVSKVFVEENDLPKITKVKIGFVVPFSMLFPLTMFNLIDTYAFFLYLITIPSSVVLIKKLSGSESYTLGSAFTVYKAVAGKILFVFFILGVISRAIMYVIKH